MLRFVDTGSNVTSLSYESRSQLDQGQMTWFCRFAWHSLGGFSAGNLLSKALSAGNDDWALRMASSSGNKIRFTDNRWQTTAGLWQIDAPAQRYQVHSIAVTYDSSSTANDPVIYLNGRPVTVTEMATPAGTYRAMGGGAVRIGNSRSNDVEFDGWLGDVALFSRILTPGEVRTLDQLGPLPLAPLVHIPCESWAPLLSLGRLPLRLNRPNTFFVQGAVNLYQPSDLPWLLTGAAPEPWAIDDMARVAAAAGGNPWHYYLQQRLVRG